MFYKNFNPENLISDKNVERDFITVAKNENSELILALLKKNYDIDTHVSHSDVCIYVVEGELEFDFMRSDDCECSVCSCKLPGENNDDKKAFYVKRGEMFRFEKHKHHSVKALKDSLFFIIKI